MSTYAQPSDLAAYTSMAAILAMSSTDQDHLLQKCERDIDQALIPPQQALTTANRKVDPAQLSSEEAFALKNATCAQAEYRVLQGEEFFVAAQLQQVSGPGGFSIRGRQPVIGPKAKRELAGTGMMPFGVQAGPQRGLIR